MTICDLCLKENRPLHTYDISMCGRWPLDGHAESKNSPLLCENCVDQIKKVGFFRILKFYFNPEASL